MQIVICLDNRRHFIGLRLVLSFCAILLVILLSAYSIIRQPSAATRLVPIGHAEDLSPGSVTHLRLPVAFYDSLRPYRRWALPLALDQDSPAQLFMAIRASFRQQFAPPVGRVSSVPIFLVRDPAGGAIALYDRDPFTACRLDWVEAKQHFEDQCSSSSYSRTGGYLRGPAPRDMDRFAVVVTAGGDIAVDVSEYQIGAFHP